MNALAPIAVIVPLGAAAVLIAVLDRIGRRAAQTIAIAAALFTLGACATLLVRVLQSTTAIVWFGGWHPGNVVGLGIAFAVDPAAAAVATFVAAIVLGALVYSLDYFDDVGTIFFVLVLAMLGGMIAFAFAADAFDLFVFYEVFSVAAYALSAYRIEVRSATQGALQFALTSTVAGLFALIAIVLLEGRTGELNLVAIGRSLAAQHDSAAIAGISLALLATGLFTRGAITPLHFWFDEVHASAPTPLCIVLSGAMVPLALYGFVRCYYTTYVAAVPPSPTLHALVSALGVVTAVTGAIMCLRETQLKRAVAFSTVAHSGVVLIAIGAFDARTLGAAAAYLAGSACAATALFGAIGIIRRAAGHLDVGRLRGAGRLLPLTNAAFGLGALVLAAEPLDGGPLARFAAVAVGAATGGALLRNWRMIFFAPGRPQPRGARPPWFLIAPTVAFALAPLVLAAPFPRVLAAGAAALLTDRHAYASALFGSSAPRIAFAFDADHGRLALLAVLGTMGACAIAWWTSTTQRAGLTRLRRALRRTPPVAGLVLLHDGDAGQYIAWIAGTAAVAALTLSAAPLR